MPIAGASRRAISAKPRQARRRGRRPASWRRPRRSTPGRAIHSENTNGKPVHRDHSSPKSHTNSKAPPAGDMPRSPISSTASAGVSSSVAPIGSGRSFGATPNRSFSKILRQRGAGPRAFVQRQRVDVLDGNAAVELHASHRTVAGDAGVGDDRVARVAGVFDRGDHRHVESPGGQRVGQSARVVDHDFQLRGDLGQRDDQRPGVQIRHRADADSVFAPSAEQSAASSRVPRDAAAAIGPLYGAARRRRKRCRPNRRGYAHGQRSVYDRHTRPRFRNRSAFSHLVPPDRTS